MKNRSFWFVLMALLCFPLALLAAEGDPAPGGGFDWATYIIPFLTPVIIMGVKWLAPKIPNLLVVSLAPMIGVALTAIGAAVGSGEFSVQTGIVLGLLGVGLRELGDQLNQARQGIGGTPEVSAEIVAQQKAAKGG